MKLGIKYSLIILISLLFSSFIFLSFFYMPTDAFPLASLPHLGIKVPYFFANSNNSKGCNQNLDDLVSYLNDNDFIESSDLIRIYLSSPSSAMLISWNDDETYVYEAIKIDKQTEAQIKNGEVPHIWQEFMCNVTSEKKRILGYPFYLFKGGSLTKDLFISLDKGLAFISWDPLSIVKMRDTLRGKEEPFNSSRVFLYKFDENFFIVNNLKISSLDRPLSFSGQWQDCENYLSIQWDFDEKPVITGGESSKWSDVPFTGEPVGLFMGVNLGSLENRSFLFGEKGSLLNLLDRFRDSSVSVCLGGVSELLSKKMLGVIFSTSGEIDPYKENVLFSSLSSDEFPPPFPLSYGVYDKRNCLFTVQDAIKSGAEFLDEDPFFAGWRNSLAWGYWDPVVTSSFFNKLREVRKFLENKDLDSKLLSIMASENRKSLFYFIVYDIYSGRFEWRITK